MRFKCKSIRERIIPGKWTNFTFWIRVFLCERKRRKAPSSSHTKKTHSMHRITNERTDECTATVKWSDKRECGATTGKLNIVAAFCPLLWLRFGMRVLCSFSIFFVCFGFGVVCFPAVFVLICVFIMQKLVNGIKNRVYVCVHLFVSLFAFACIELKKSVLVNWKRIHTHTVAVKYENEREWAHENKEKAYLPSLVYVSSEHCVIYI